MAIALRRFKEVRFENVCRHFGALHALRGMTLTIKQGEFIALLGPSGCGKSTMLNILAGLLPTTEGSIWLDTQRIDVLKPEDRGFGMVFQNYALFPHMSVRDNVGFGLKMRGMAKAEINRKVGEAIALVRLQGQEAKLPGQLSGGQQQRVAIARAIVVEPPLVLMDEPLSNLDAKLRLEMRAEIRRIHNALGATTIYVTHDQDEALSMADRVVVMKDGLVRQIGTPAELYEAPSDVDVADFMGFRNRLRGEVEAVSSDRATIRVGGRLVTGISKAPLSVGQNAVVAIRTDDLVAGGDSGNSFSATVETIEYRGREFVGTARTQDGIDLIFHSPGTAPIGSSVELRADPERVVIFADGAGRA